MAKGDANAALRAATKVGYDLFTAEIAAEAAIMLAQRGGNTADLIHTALDYVNRPLAVYKKIKGEDAPSDYDRARQAELYALIARAKSLSGQDPAELFAQALEIAPTITPELYRASAYHEIARNQALSSIDGRPAWKLAVEAAGESLKGQGKIDWIDEAEYSMYMEGYARIQVQLGYYDTAMDTVERIAAVDTSDRGSVLFKTEVLSDIGVTQAKSSLTEAELEALPNNVIQSILSGQGERAKEAVLYFGLDRRIA